MPCNRAAASSRRRDRTSSLCFSWARISCSNPSHSSIRLARGGADLGRLPASPLGVLRPERVDCPLDALQLQQRPLLGRKEFQQPGEVSGLDQFELPAPHVAQLHQARVLGADQLDQDVGFRGRPSFSFSASSLFLLALQAAQPGEGFAPLLAVVVGGLIEAGVLGHPRQGHLGPLQRAPGRAGPAQAAIGLRQADIGLERFGTVRKAIGGLRDTPSLPLRTAAGRNRSRPRQTGCCEASPSPTASGCGRRGVPSR